jgi:hypothetical protein
MDHLVADPQWLLTVVEAPLIAALVWILHSLRRTLPDPLQGEPGASPPPPERGSETVAALSRAREELAAFKLEVARTYVPLSLIRDVDSRLSRQLLRIEAKLDEVARTAAAAAGAITGQALGRDEPRHGPDTLP